MEAQQKFQVWEAELKAQMFALKKATSIPLGHCYEAYAKQQGYSTYAALRAAKKEELGCPAA